MNCDPSVRLSVFPIRIAAQSAVHVSTGVARWGSFCPICSNCAMLIEWGGELMQLSHAVFFLEMSALCLA